MVASFLPLYLISSRRRAFFIWQWPVGRVGESRYEKNFRREKVPRMNADGSEGEGNPRRSDGFITGLYYVHLEQVASAD